MNGMSPPPFEPLSESLPLTVVSVVDGFLPFSVCSTVILSPSLSGLSAGTGTSHLPSSPTSVSPITLSSLSLTTILAPGLPFPVILSSPSVGWSTCGVSDFPFSFTVVVVSDGFLSFSV